MSQWTQALQVCLPTVLALTAFMYAMHFGGEHAPQPLRARRVFAWVALGLHVSLFALRSFEVGGWPDSGPFSTLSWVALGILLLHSMTGSSDTKPGAAAIVFGVVTLMQLGASCFGPFDRTGTSHGTSFDLLHVGTSVLASSAIILAGIYGCLYLAAWRRMRQRRFGPLLRGLPPMDELVKHMRRSALLGFILLAVGINFGIGWAHMQGVEAFSYTDPWVLAMIALWLHFGFIAFSSKIPGATAMRASWAAAAGFFLLVTAMTLSTLVPHLSFHWNG